jgi:CHAT domain-containing protein
MWPVRKAGMMLGLWFASIWFGLVLLDPSVAFPAATPSADQLMQEGLTAFRNGSFPRAVLRLTEAAQAYEQEKKLQDRTQALLHLSQALQQVGSYREAGGALQTALDLAGAHEEWNLMPVILGRLGTIYLVLGQVLQAEETLNRAVVMSRETGERALLASLLNDVGNVLFSQGKQAAAEAAYAESTSLANAEGNQVLAVTAMLNSARAMAAGGDKKIVRSRLDQAAREIPALEDSHDKALAWLSLGVAYEHLLPAATAMRPVETRPPDNEKGSRGIEVRPRVEPSPDPSSQQEADAQISSGMTQEIMKQAAASFRSAITVSQVLDDARMASYGWGYLGSLYEREGREEEALTLTRRAVATAQRVHAPESLYRWHWQTGRLLAAQGQIDQAILAYRRAMHVLQPIRPELLAGNHDRQTSFRETNGRLYFELSDLLLRRAAATRIHDPQRSRELLMQAQDTVESFKAAELQDYFKDACVAAARARSTSLAEATEGTALIYPVILADRLELLVSLPDGLKQFVVPVKGVMLSEEVYAFRRALEDRHRQDYLPHARTLYDWLIRPLQQDLDRSGITTLVFVPDGALRTIPMAPLHDGRVFLIEKYALAVTPGLMLTDPRPINRMNVRLLSAGLSESVQGFPALPNVEKELSAIRTIYGGTLLLNDQFQVVRMEQELKDQPFTILHIASHGTVQRDVRDSYILAFDAKITMSRLSELVGLFEHRNSPLELLTLSACETAAGDDRAALGLAGIAIKAGARSALATLWFIDDAASSDLVAEFYRQLQHPALSKAAALQRAQLAVLKDPARQHPSFWAPFLLINNWL